MSQEIDYEKVNQIFVPEVAERFRKSREINAQFVQYTSADSALKIIKSECVWLRNTNCMNDYMEIEYGIQKLIEYFGNDVGKPFWECLDAIHPGISIEIKKRFDDWRFDLSQNTYVACVSEHDVEENEFGRLSMWRAYARNSGVSLIINGSAMLSEPDATRAYTFPVFYKTNDELKQFFADFVSRINSQTS